MDLITRFLHLHSIDIVSIRGLKMNHSDQLEESKSGEESVSNSPQEEIVDNQTEITTIGLWIEAFGTLLSAIGNTPISVVNQNFLFNIDAIGDVLQLSGTTIQIEDEKTGL